MRAGAARKAISYQSLKVLSVYLLIQFLVFLPSILTIAELDQQRRSVMDSSFSPAVAVYSITAVAYLVVAMVLFFKARKIGLLFAEHPDEELCLTGVVSDDVLALFFRCLGVYALVTWVPSLVQSFSKAVITIVRSPEPVPWVYTFFWMQIVTPLTGCVLGLLLLLRTQAIIRLSNTSRERPGDKEG